MLVCARASYLFSMRMINVCIEKPLETFSTALAQPSFSLFFFILIVFCESQVCQRMCTCTTSVRQINPTFVISSRDFLTYLLILKLIVQQNGPSLVRPSFESVPLLSSSEEDYKFDEDGFDSKQLKISAAPVFCQTNKSLVLTD